MKKLKAWQKAGLITALVTGLTISPLAIKNSGLEGKLTPTIGMSTANAMEVNPQGYEIPDLTGRTPSSAGYKEDNDGDGIIYKYEYFLNKTIARLSRDGKIFAYVIDQNNDGKMDYTIQDNDGDGKFESKYGRGERINIPQWVR